MSESQILDPEDATATDESVDQVKRLLDGDQKRDPSIPTSRFTAPGEGEHQMKGTYANVNPVAVGEAESFVKRQTEQAQAAKGIYPEQVIPRETKVKSGTNKFTDTDLDHDTRVAGGREVGQYPEALGITRGYRGEQDGALRDPQKVDPTTGIAYTNEAGGTVVLNADGSKALSLDPLGIEADVSVEPDADVETIDQDKLPEGVEAVDPEGKTPVLAEDIPVGGFDYPVKVDNGIPVVGEDGHHIVVTDDGDEYSAADVDSLTVLDQEAEEESGVTHEQLGERNNIRDDINAEASDDQKVGGPNDDVTPEDTNQGTAPSVEANAPAPDGLPPADTEPTTGAPDPAELELGTATAEEKDASNQSGGSWSMDNSKDELQAEAESRGLDSSGTKQEILARLNG